MHNKIAYVPQMEQMIPLIQEALAAGQSVRIFPMGTSMLPMLRRGIDSVVLSPVTGRLKKYDIPLYIRENGKYILHGRQSISAGAGASAGADDCSGNWLLPWGSGAFCDRTVLLAVLPSLVS